MTRFYARSDAWLTRYDHNHLRITRIVTAVGDLLGPEPAASFHAGIIARNAAAGSPVNPDTLGFWQRALSCPPRGDQRWP